MSDLIRPLITGFRTADFNVRLQLADLSDEQAKRRPRGEEGASISWIVGHMLSSRCIAIRACGITQDNPYQQHFSFQKPATDGADYPSIDRLRQEWTQLNDRLIEAIEIAGDEKLTGQTELPNPIADGSLLSALAFLQWHEAYHVGVIGSVRAQMGLKRTHELALEAMGRAQS